MNIKIKAALVILCCLCMSSQLQAQSAGASKPESAKSHLTREVEMLRKQMVTKEQAVMAVEKQIESSLESLREKSVSDVAFEDVFRMLQMQKVELSIELEGLDARLALLKERAASSEDSEDDVTKAQRESLRRYVANQKEQLDRIKTLVSKGFRAEEEVSKAELLLSQAQLQLQEFEAKARKASPKYVEALFETSLAIAERKAKLQAVKKLLTQHVESRAQITKLGDLLELRNSHRAGMQDLVNRLLELETAISEF